MSMTKWWPRAGGSYARVLLLAILCCTATAHVGGEPPESEKNKAKKPKPKAVMTVEQARQRARLLHRTYESTLHTVHRAYFEEGRRLSVPARVLEDVFWQVDQETRGKTRWIAVNTPAMNIDHKPKSDVEKQAAKSLASGKEEFELVADGVYHRGGSVSLFASCLRCHENSLAQTKRRRRVAGLLISIPVTDAAASPSQDKP